MSRPQQPTVDIICTDRGQHKRTWMTLFSQNTEGGWSARIGDGTSKHQMFSIMRTDGRATCEFDCARCPRRVRVSYDRLERDLDKTRRQGRTELDVSWIN
jgi:hypothetical protein